MEDRILIAPSILSADFTRLAEAVSQAEAGAADYIHVDVMDGHFVPNLTVGPPVVKALKRVTDIPLDVHLMIDNAEDTVDWYLETGADLVTVHVEACDHLHRTLQHIRAAEALAGVSLNPATPIETLADVVGACDLILVMSVNPGFGGQEFIPRSIDKLRRLRAMCAAAGADPLIEVDGGIDATTAPLVVEAGARVLVAGSAVYCTEDPVAAMSAIRGAGEAGI